MFVRSAYNYDVDAASNESGLLCLDPSLAKQSFAEEVDINTIVRRFGLDGELPTNVRMPSYGDFTGVSDFQTAMLAVAQANEAFDEMPARVRARFHNNPAEFVDFVSDDANAEEAKKLGLVKPEVLAADAAALVASREASAAAQAAAVLPAKGASAAAQAAAAAPAKPAGGTVST